MRRFAAATNRFILDMGLSMIVPRQLTPRLIVEPRGNRRHIRPRGPGRFPASTGGAARAGETAAFSHGKES